MNRDVPRLLEQAKPKNFAEMGARIAAWQQAGRGQPSFGNQYSYHNFICERPERLWLIVPFLEHAEVALRLNGQPVTPMWDSPSNSAFADITDLVRYGAENRLELRAGEMAPDALLGPYLLYPEEASTSQVLAGPRRAERRVVYTRPPGPAPRPRYRPGAAPRVTEAKMMSNVTLTAKAELRATLDLPPERIQRVMYFESGFPWMGQHPLRYDRDGRYWSAQVTPGDRARIQENEYVYVWAEATDGLRSEYYPVRVNWDFLP